MRNLIKWMTLAVGVCVTSTAAAAQANPSCNVLGVYGTIALMVCPDAQSDADFIAAGQSVCDDIAVRNVCNAWIWRDQNRAATYLPMDSHQLDSVTALWIHRAGELKVCARDGCFAGQIRR